MESMNRKWPLIALLFLLLHVGCSKGPGRREITGKVNYDGKPVVYGMIYFEPDPAKGRGGPQGAGEIRDGIYRTNPDYGPVPGPTVVRITGWDQVPGGGAPPLFNYSTQVDLADEDKKDLDFDVPLVKGKRAK
jgi:hypothetical protein